MTTICPLSNSPATVVSRTPKLAIKQSNLSIDPTEPSNRFSTMGVLTTKEWVIPPRPKPGRKPATDTPQTKRKAQNRAAQRAFRERRAARVGELEEQLEEVREEYQQRENDLKSRIKQLEEDVKLFSGELNSWKLRYDTLDRINEYEKKTKEAALAELAFLRKDGQTMDSDTILPTPPRPIISSQTDYSQVSPEPNSRSEPTNCCSCVVTNKCACLEQAIAATVSECSNCTPDSTSACLEGFDAGAQKLKLPPESKRSHSPATHEASDKRPRQSESSMSLEIDFTSQFSTKPTRIDPSPTVGMTPVELCGFCDDDTFCICAEDAVTSAREESGNHQLQKTLNQITTSPSERDSDPAMPNWPLNRGNSRQNTASSSKSELCAKGPGTCQQCLIDPRSGQFCRSLSELPRSDSQAFEGCCGNATSGGCCKSIPIASLTEFPPTLSCADAFKTLSSHKNFDQANNELNTWVGRLHATTATYPGRAPIEVETASVMGVLKLFDRRLGRG